MGNSVPLDVPPVILQNFQFQAGLHYTCRYLISWKLSKKIYIPFAPLFKKFQNFWLNRKFPWLTLANNIGWQCMIKFTQSST